MTQVTNYHGAALDLWATEHLTFPSKCDSVSEPELPPNRERESLSVSKQLKSNTTVH